MAYQLLMGYLMPKFIIFKGLICLILFNGISIPRGLFNDEIFIVKKLSISSYSV